MVHVEIRQVGLVARELLVAALAHLDHDRAAVAHQLRYEVERDADPVGDRLVLREHQRGQVLAHRLLVDHHLVVVGLEARGDPPRPLELVQVTVVGEPDAERANGPVHQLRHHRHVRRGVDPAGQQHSEGNVRHQTLLDRRVEQLLRAPHGVRAQRFATQLAQLLEVVAAAGQGVPIDLGLHRAVGLHERAAARGHLEDAAEHRERGRRRQEREVVVDGARLDVGRDIRMPEQRLDLRREQEARARPGEVERLDPDTVARQDQAALLRVPDPDREHAVDALEHRGAPLLVAVDDHLGVGVVGLEDVAAGEQLLAQRQVVVDLAVEDDLDAAVLVRHRLVRRRREVDDREPPEREPDLATGCDPQPSPSGPRCTIVSRIRPSVSPSTGWPD
jgi:hypothetical protein